jgi:hypothetical protein
LKKLLAALFVVLTAAGIAAGSAPAATADPLLHYDLEGTISDDPPQPGGPIACVNPHIKVFGQLLLEDPICI